MALDRRPENMVKNWKVDTVVDKVSGTVVGSKWEPEDMEAALDTVWDRTLDK